MGEENNQRGAGGMYLKSKKPAQGGLFKIWLL